MTQMVLGAVAVVVPLDVGCGVLIIIVAAATGRVLLFLLARVADQQRIKCRQDEERRRLAGHQTAQNGPRQRRVGLAAALQRQAPESREERRQSRHRDRPHPQAGRLADRLRRRQPLMPPQFLSVVCHQHRVGDLNADDEDESQQGCTFTADLVR